MALVNGIILPHIGAPHVDRNIGKHAFKMRANDVSRKPDMSLFGDCLAVIGLQLRQPSRLVLRTAGAQQRDGGDFAFAFAK